VAGYSEKFAKGLYHDAVHERPDLVVAMNPGFASEPTLWWPTLHYLSSHGIPILGTGYGNDAMTLYRYDSAVTIDEGARSAHFPGALRRKSMKNIYSKDSEASFHVENYVSERGNKVRVYQPFERDMKNHRGSVVCKERPQNERKGPTCGDGAGTSYMAQMVGYGMPLNSWNPFVYCDRVKDLDCTSNGMLFVLTTEASKIAASASPPSSLFRKLLLDELKCESSEAKLSKLSCARGLVQKTATFSATHIDKAMSFDEATHIDEAAEFFMRQCK